MARDTGVASALRRDAVSGAAGAAGSPSLPAGSTAASPATSMVPTTPKPTSSTGSWVLGFGFSAAMAWASAPVTPSISSSIRASPTLMISPTAPKRSTTAPSRGAGMSATTLSVSTWTTGSPMATRWPFSTCHFRILPSWTPSPMSGNLKM